MCLVWCVYVSLCISVCLVNLIIGGVSLCMFVFSLVMYVCLDIRGYV